MQGASGSHTFGQWLELKAEYGSMCPYCQVAEPEIRLTQDHIVPLAAGGSDDIDNIQPLCVSCNASKGDRETGPRLETYLFQFLGLAWVPPEQREVTT